MKQYALIKAGFSSATQLLIKYVIGSLGPMHIF